MAYNSLGWFGDLVAQHLYVDAVPMPQRRIWDFASAGLTIVDDPINGACTFALSGDFTDLPLTVKYIDLAPQLVQPDDPTEGARLYYFDNGFQFTGASGQDFRVDYGDGLITTLTVGDGSIPLDIVASALTVNGAPVGGSSAVTRGGSLDLVDAQAWAAMGSPLTIASEITTFYRLHIQAEWPDHTYLEGTPYGAMSVSASVDVAVTRDAADGITIEQRNGDAYWDLLRIYVRAFDAGSGSWGLEVERANDESDATTPCEVTVTVTTLSTQQWSSETATQWVAPDGDPLQIALDLDALTTDFTTHLNDIDEAPTASKIPVRTSAGVLRAQGLKCEKSSTIACDFTDTDGSTPQAVGITSAALTATCTSFTEKDSTGVYSVARTCAAAFTEVYGGVTSVTSRIAQAGSGAGKLRAILGGLGASGSANGVFVSGLENGNTVLGGAHWLGLGSLVGGVSDKVRFGTGTPGSMTSFLDVYQLAAGTTLLDAGANSLSLQGGANTGQITLGAGITTLSSSSGYVQVSTSVANIYLSAPATFGIAITGTRYRTQLIMPPQEVTFSTATTATLLSIAMVDGEAEDLDILVTWFNSTDTQYGRIRLSTPPLVKCAAGTASNVVAAAWAAQEGDEAGSCSASINLSTNNVQIRFTTPDTDNRKVSVYVTRRKAGPTF